MKSDSWKNIYCTATNIINIKAPGYSGHYIDIFTVTGKLVARKQLDANGFASIDLTSCNSSLLLLKVGEIVEKVVLIKP